MDIIHTGNKPAKITEALDSDAMLYYTFHCKPQMWVAGREYIEGEVVYPLDPTGFYYKVSSSGVSGETEPVWSTVKNTKTIDNTVEFVAVNNESYLPHNALLINAEFKVTDDIALSNISFTSYGMATVQVGPIGDTTKTFTLTLRMTVDTGHATHEIDERSIIVKVVSR